MDIPTACPVCGGYSLTQDDQSARMLAVSEVLTVKVLEVIGKRIVRNERSRFAHLHGTPFHEAHTLWPMESDPEVTILLRGAWDVVPAMMSTHGNCGEASPEQVTSMLDDYVHDLVLTGTKHSVEELAYRFRTVLGMPVYYRTPCYSAAS